MAIRIGDIGIPNKKGHRFADLHFDLEVGDQSAGRAGFNTPITKGRDIIADFDMAAIRNAVTNILTTSPGQRPLNIAFGTKLLNFLGQPVDDVTAQLLGSEITRSLQLWEPRIDVKKVFIRPIPDEHMFEIAIVLDVPALNEQTVLTGSLNDQRGFNLIVKPIPS